MHHFNKNQSGLTLVEAMVSLVFLTLGLIPILGVIVSSISLSARIENNLIAANLAQEGIEVVRAIRDASWMSGEAFNQNLPNGDYLVAFNSTSLLAYNPSAYLKIDSNKIYSYTAGTDTLFKRRINITNVPSACNCEIIVISEVTWVERTQSRTARVEDHLYDWR